MNSDEDWSPCERGTLLNAVDKQRRTERTTLINRRALFAGSSAAVAAAALAFAGLFRSSSLSCSDVTSLAHNYVEGKLDSATEALVDDHRQRCSGCDHMLTSLASKRSV